NRVAYKESPMLCKQAWRAVVCSALIAIAMALWPTSDAYAQGCFGGGGGGSRRMQSVGGIYIDAEGVVTNSSIDQTNQLREIMIRALQEVPGDLNQPNELRKISLKGLEAALAEHVGGKPLQ